MCVKVYLRRVFEYELNVNSLPISKEFLSIYRYEFALVSQVVQPFWFEERKRERNWVNGVS